MAAQNSLWESTWASKLSFTTKPATILTKQGNLNYEALLRSLLATLLHLHDVGFSIADSPAAFQTININYGVVAEVSRT